MISGYLPRSRFVSSSNAPLQHRGGGLRDEAKTAARETILKGNVVDSD